MANLGTSYRHFLARTVMMVRMLLYGFNIQVANLGQGYQHFLAVSVMMVPMLLYGSNIVIIAKKGKVLFKYRIDDYDLHICFRYRTVDVSKNISGMEVGVWGGLNYAQNIIMRQP